MCIRWQWKAGSICRVDDGKGTDRLPKYLESNGDDGISEVCGRRTKDSKFRTRAGLFGQGPRVLEPSSPSHPRLSKSLL